GGPGSCRSPDLERRGELGPGDDAAVRVQLVDDPRGPGPPGPTAADPGVTQEGLQLVPADRPVVVGVVVSEGGLVVAPELGPHQGGQLVPQLLLVLLARHVPRPPDSASPGSASRPAPTAGRGAGAAVRRRTGR